MRNKFLIISIIIMASVLETEYVLAQADEQGLCVPHKVSVQPHFGQVQYDIQLCQLKDPDFDWSVKLTYTSDGFRPLVYSGIVGHNWSLSLAGSISREIKGLPDDYKDQDIHDIGAQGFRYMLVLKDSNISYQNYITSEDIYAHSDGFAWMDDASSDVYSFSFCGYSGRFVIGWDGKIKCLSGDFVDADFSGYTYQRKNDLPSNTLFSDLKVPFASEIKLTTLDGYQYYFGGSVDALEYSYTFPMRVTEISERPMPVISAWHLSKVVAPNGRTIQCYYHPQTRDFYSYLESGIGGYYANYTPLFDSHIFPSLTPGDQESPNAPIENPNIWWIFREQSVCKSVALDSVVSSDHSFAIRLNYVNDSDYVFTHLPYATSYALSSSFPLRQQKPFVRHIRVESGDYALASWHMDYSMIRVGEEQIPRQYLQSCTTDNHVGYSFQYDFEDLATITDPCTYSKMDLYGYRKTPFHYKTGILKSVRDVLGGITTFSYEHCAYDSIRIFYCKNNQPLQSIICGNTDDLIHTARITQIKVLDNQDRVILKKTYSYGEAPIPAMSPRGENEGTRDWPIFTNDGILNIDYAILVDSSAANTRYRIRGYLHTQPGTTSPLEYTKVEESVYKNSSNTLTYRNIYYYATTCDSLEYRSYHEDKFFDAYSLISLFKRRACIAKIERYKGSQVAQKTEYAYSPIVTPDYTVNITGLQCKVYYPQVLVRSTQQTNYETNGSFVESHHFTYDAMHRLTREDIFAGGEHRFRRNSYIDNLFANDTIRIGLVTWGCWWMMKEKRLTTPIETTEGVVKNGVDYVTSGYVLLPRLYEIGPYHIVDDILPPDTIPNSRTEPTRLDPPEFSNEFFYSAPFAALRLRLTNPISDFQPIVKTNGEVTVDNRYDTTIVYNYLNHLRPLTITVPGGEPIRYTWDDKYLNVISEQVGERISYFTWQPYIGVTSKTDPRGLTTYYRYNEWGNIVEVYRMNEGKKEVLSVYEYHYPTIE